MTGRHFEIKIHGPCLVVVFAPATVITRKLVLQVLEREIELIHGLGKNDLWDIRGCVIDSDINAESLREIVLFLKERKVRKEKSGKTALLVDTTVAFGLVRSFQSIAEIKEIGYEIEVFMDEEKAMCWLGDEAGNGA